MGIDPETDYDLIDPTEMFQYEIHDPGILHDKNSSTLVIHDSVNLLGPLIPMAFTTKADKDL